MFPYLLVTIGSGVSVLKVGIMILDMCLSRILSQFYSGLRIRIHFFADPNQADFLNADPDPAFKKLYETTWWRVFWSWKKQKRIEQKYKIM